MAVAACGLHAAGPHRRFAGHVGRPPVDNEEQM